VKLVGLESNDEVTSRLKNALLRDRLKEDGVLRPCVTMETGHEYDYTRVMEKNEEP